MLRYVCMYTRMLQSAFICMYASHKSVQPMLRCAYVCIYACMHVCVHVDVSITTALAGVLCVGSLSMLCTHACMLLPRHICMHACSCVYVFVLQGAYNTPKHTQIARVHTKLAQHSPSTNIPPQQHHHVTYIYIHIHTQKKHTWTSGEHTPCSNNAATTRS